MEHAITLEPLERQLHALGLSYYSTRAQWVMMVRLQDLSISKIVMFL